MVKSIGELTFALQADLMSRMKINSLPKAIFFCRMLGELGIEYDMSIPINEQVFDKAMEDESVFFDPPSEAFIDFLEERRQELQEYPSAWKH